MVRQRASNVQTVLASFTDLLMASARSASWGLKTIESDGTIEKTVRAKWMMKPEDRWVTAHNDPIESGQGVYDSSRYRLGKIRGCPSRIRTRQICLLYNWG